jgi:cold shock CspA family protein/ribosome-associated translation inhibitor RaiA
MSFSLDRSCEIAASRARSIVHHLWYFAAAPHQAMPVASMIDVKQAVRGRDKTRPSRTLMSINARAANCVRWPGIPAKRGGFDMQTPLQLTFEDIGHSDSIEARIREEAAKLEQFYDRMMSMRVVVARPQHRHHKGDTFHVRIHIVLPGAADITISREPAATGAHEDVYVTIRDAFKAARRQLQDFSRKRQSHIKEHETPPHGTIAALYPEQDHGFITASDGREIYFHRNSVAGAGLEDLRLGQEVRFSEAMGDKGPQATLVRTVGKHHLD